MKKKLKVTEGWVLIERLYKATEIIVDEKALNELESYFRIVLVGDKCRFAREGDAVILNPQYLSMGVPVTDMTELMHYYAIQESAIVGIYEGELKDYFVSTCKMTTKMAFDKLDFSSKIAMPKARA